jgi:hypothetical protein
VVLGISLELEISARKNISTKVSYAIQHGIHRFLSFGAEPQNSAVLTVKQMKLVDELEQPAPAQTPSYHALVIASVEIKMQSGPWVDTVGSKLEALAGNSVGSAKYRDNLAGFIVTDSGGVCKRVEVMQGPQRTNLPSTHLFAGKQPLTVNSVDTHAKNVGELQATSVHVQQEHRKLSDSQTSQVLVGTDNEALRNHNMTRTVKPLALTAASGALENLFDFSNQSRTLQTRQEGVSSLNEFRFRHLMPRPTVANHFQALYFGLRQY